MYVVKRNKTTEPVSFDKITRRIENLCDGLDRKFVDPIAVAQKVVSGVIAGVTTTQLDELAAETAANMSRAHPDYSRLAGRIVVSALHKTTVASFVETMQLINTQRDPGSGAPRERVSDEKLVRIARRNADRIQGALKFDRDYQYDFFGIRTLMCGYLMRYNGEVVERPQHMLMRVAIGIHQDDIDAVIQTYECMSKGLFTHATPTLFNAGTPNGQLSSCFLLTMKDDSIQGVFETLGQTAAVSKGAGGVGLAVSKIRANGATIGGSGTSSGLVPMLRVFNNTARYVDQGGGKRNGAFAIYIEPWHADIFEVLQLRKNHGAEELRARDLFYALWIPDLFMQRVKEDGMWSLMCPNECPGLYNTHGAAFDIIYKRYESEGKFRKQVRAQELWNNIIDTQIETGQPYMLYKDACNAKSNQQNLGTIQCSNLCTEIVQYTSPFDVAVCNLASIALNKFVVAHTGEPGAKPHFDHRALHNAVEIVTKNLNRVIDQTYYPLPEAKESNVRERPIGIGVQGLADTFALLDIPFDSPEAKQLNIDIFETIYHAAVSASVQLAREAGAPYSNFVGSPASNGKLQFDLWGVRPNSGRYDWDTLKEHISTFGMCNSLLVAPMPTATTAQILGNNEGFEPFNSNMYVRRVLSGEYQVVNKHLVRKLADLGLWSHDMSQRIMAHNGSVQLIEEIPKHVRDVYKTVWEIERKTLVDYAADRGPYVCQSQSLNLHMAAPNRQKLTSYHFYAWSRGLKTGMYYLRSKAASDATKFTVDTRHAPTRVAAAAATTDEAPASTTQAEDAVCDRNGGECSSCSA